MHGTQTSCSSMPGYARRRGHCAMHGGPHQTGGAAACSKEAHDVDVAEHRQQLGLRCELHGHAVLAELLRASHALDGDVHSSRPGDTLKGPPVHVGIPATPDDSRLAEAICGGEDDVGRPDVDVDRRGEVLGRGGARRVDLTHGCQSGSVCLERALDGRLNDAAD